ncbi:PLP-dependent aminotransferase family protein [Rouxiella sp. WC2420]|uniref:PLP-dependent aminotransferase family protein n=1 Tax=Rouxiella sp. WC2420 TaxID=3234145 RepID=A0AB39VUU6_9GAMM
MNRYEHLAHILGERIEQGLYPAGHRLPSVRILSDEHGVSVSTVQQAYRMLEDRQLVEARPKSGYFVSLVKRQAGLPATCRTPQRPVDISQWDQVLAQITSRTVPGMISLGGGTPDVSSPSLKPLSRALAKVAQRSDSSALFYDTIEGSKALRDQIARLMIDSGSHIDAQNLVITTGCHEALSIAIRSVCEVGDIVAVDSPSFHGAMQTLKGFGMKALEIPTDPVTGISIEALEMALEQWPIKAIQLTPTCNNPLGYNMPDERKKALLRLAQCYDIAIIEDDVYGDLAFQYPRPATIYSFDDDGRVLLCSSFSKTLAPGLRVGWIAPGRYRDIAIHMKYIGTGATATQPQLAIADFIQQGHYQTHLRRVRQQYQQKLCLINDWVVKYFPQGVGVSRPQGGFLLWIELDEKIDTLRLNRLLEPEKIQISVGSIFSAAGKYRNCLRLNFANLDENRHEAAIKRVGETVHEMMKSS